MVGPKMNLILNLNIKHLIIERKQMSIRYVYLREKSNNFKANGEPAKGFPVATVALSIDRNTNKIKYGVATVHPSDKKSFSKETGRSLATGRLTLQGKELVMPKNSYNNMNDILRLIFKEMSEDKKTPTRARRAIARWMQESEINSDDYNFIADAITHNIKLGPPKLGPANNN